MPPAETPPAETHRHPARDGERGAIAILALWVMAIVFVLLAAASFTTGGEIMITGNAVAAGRARAAAEGGVELGLLRLLRRRQQGTTIFDGTPEIWQDDGVRVAVRIIDEAGLIDLNEAPLDLLTGLFVAVGRPQGEALLLACAIVERRGGSDAGCPEADFGSGPPPATHRFAVPEELAQLPGFGEALYAAIADDVTVATRASAIDPMVAPRTVLLAIPGATTNLVDSFLEERATWHDFATAGEGVGGEGVAGEGLAMTAAAPYVDTSPDRDFTIEAVAQAGDARYRAELGIELTGNPQSPFLVRTWRMPPVDRGFVPPPQPPRVP